ncbi:tetratricopeptide repeat protein [Chryseobacterium sp.]|uniref:tetratricopeptide repeat protein n=1 Tax=Chryseobacterium sp. TaxID=1871047 RepID=UPI0025C3F2C9|nr:tetratricopeptide repeat protein [Chryseobacterium sp.]
MKKTLQIILGLIALGFLIIIVKENFFTSAETKSYNEGWEAYEKQQYELAVFHLNHVNQEKYPDVSVALGSSYLKLGNYNEAITYLKKAYDKGYGKGSPDYDKILNSLGIAYMNVKEFSKARDLLQQADKLGNPMSKHNLQVLDSLEQIRSLE